MTRGDRGSTIPLILGFFLVALLAVAGSVALADAFVQQRDLQDVCDGAAAAAAASAVDLTRDAGLGEGRFAAFRDPARIESAVAGYLARDPGRRTVMVRAELSPDRTTLTLHCAQRQHVAFGAIVGNPTITHTAVSSARASLR